MSLDRRLAAAHDPKGRLISTFVGAVLLPSLALSYVSLNFVPQLAQGTRMEAVRRLERGLYDFERDVAQHAQARALEAGRAVGTELLLEGRMDAIAEVLGQAGLPAWAFESLHLEASSPRRGLAPGEAWGGDAPRDVLAELEAQPSGDEDGVVWTGSEGQVMGLLRYRFAAEYVRRDLVREYFEATHPDPGLVFRVADAKATVVYETAPTPDGRFEISRPLGSPSFLGLRASVRYKDRSIEQDVRRWELGTLGLIGFIDLMLAAGLYLVYSNVQREVRLSKLKSDFVANVSHELKTPLALIRLFAETLELGRVASEEKKRQYYRVINKESKRLTTLIDNILDFSRIEAGRKEYRLAPVDVADIVREVVEAYRFQVEQQGFAFEVAVEEPLPIVRGDREALEQALLNLVNNALKYSRDDKSIRLHARAEGGRVLVSVTDRGIGVVPGEQGKIFEKFYRAEDSLVHETKGSGLGLPLVRHIMEAHGGRVEVTSDPGQGSTFTLVLPGAERTAPLLGTGSEAGRG